MNVVLDTNVFISGIFWSGSPYKILKIWQQGKIDLIVSQEILDEYDRVSRLLSKQYPDIDLSPFIELLTMHAKLYMPIILKKGISRDPTDDKFIACAISSNTRFIISGDQDLLSISGYQNIHIIKPAAFIKQNVMLFD